jgi:ribosomal protein L11 methyltransferase
MVPALWNLSIVAAREAEEAVSELLSETFGQPTTSYTKIDTGQTRVTIFLPSMKAWSAASRARLGAGLRRIEASGLRPGRARISLRKIRPRDWAESWKRHFKPIEFGPALLIKPTWSKRRPRARQAIVLLDPGLSFGTGQHPTTAFCLQQIVKQRAPGKSQSFLDIGTGSGILAIAAAKLGYAPVEAFDLDPEAVRIARANARQNGVAARIHFSRQDASRPAKQSEAKYSMVCANLISSLLLAERSRILGRLASGGRLVIAGILKEEFAAVQKAYESAGLRLVAARTEGEWRSGSFQ